jgi:hypothetical protein
VSRTFSASAPLLLPLLSPELHIPESTNRGNLHSGGKQGFYIQRGKARRFAFRKGKQKDLLSGGKDQAGKRKELCISAYLGKGLKRLLCAQWAAFNCQLFKPLSTENLREKLSLACQLIFFGLSAHSFLPVD